MVPPAAAQEAGGAPTPIAQPRFATEVVVTPERGETPRAQVPAATAVLEQRDIEMLPIAHPGELTAYLPGFFAVRPEFHAGRPVLSARGFFGGGEAEYVRLLVDGVPVADAESGLIDWSSIALGAIARVEAARGPGATFYGDSAVGGVIQVFTKAGGARGQGAISGGSFATVDGDVTYGGRARAVGYMMSGAGRRTDGAFEHGAANEAQGGLSLDGRMKGLSWRWNVEADARMREDPGALTRTQAALDPTASDPLYRFDRTERTGGSTAVALRHDSAFHPQGRVYVRWRDDELLRTIPLFPGFGDRGARDLSGVTIGGSLDGERTIASRRPATLRFGLDLALDDVDAAYASVSDTGAIGAPGGEIAGRRLRSGIFVASMIDLTSRLRMAAGVRRDSVDDRGFGGLADGTADQTAWSPRLGVVARLSERHGISAFAQVARAFKAPTLDQRFDRRPYPDFRGGTFTISNPALTPQRAVNVEGGASGGGPLRWSALVYQMMVDDEIDFDARTFSYANIGESVHRGLEVELEGAWTRFRPIFSYGLVHVVAEGGDTQLKNVPRHVVRAGANGELPGAVTGYVRFTRTAGGVIDDEGVVRLEGQATVDLRLSRRIGRAVVFVDALNVTGDRYDQYGFTLTDFVGRSVPYVYAGAPRAFRLGVRVGF
jgi:outer membrane receptor protein involved in Fe transport